jgi:hypothetical protein
MYKMQGNVRECKEILENARKHVCSRKYYKLLSNISNVKKVRNARKCQKMLDNARKCKKMQENVRKCNFIENTKWN